MVLNFYNEIWYGWYSCCISRVVKGKPLINGRSNYLSGYKYIDFTGSLHWNCCNIKTLRHALKQPSRLQFIFTFQVWEFILLFGLGRLYKITEEALFVEPKFWLVLMRKRVDFKGYKGIIRFIKILRIWVSTVSPRFSACTKSKPRQRRF